jgi:hypothetical protein
MTLSPAGATAHTAQDSIKETSRKSGEIISPVRGPVYFGYEVALGITSLSLESDIHQLNGLTIPFIGGRLGGMLSGTRGKLKLYGGLYYPDSTVPYDFDLLEGGFTTNVYFLRLKKKKYHTIEPYATADINHKLVKYYGTYLTDESEPRKSSAVDDLLGKTNHTQIRFGAGFEFQLENNDHKFIHLFVEGGLGTELIRTSSDNHFTNTGIADQVWIAVGVDFGNIINR